MSAHHLLLISLLSCVPASARESVAIWLGSRPEPAAVEQFRQQWQKQSGQPLTLNEQIIDELAEAELPAQTWFVISADDLSDQQLLKQRFHGVIISLRAERARVVNDIAALNRGRWTGIYADPSPQQMMNIVQAIYPQWQNIGVVFDRRYASVKSEWMRATQRYQKRLQGLYLHEGEPVERILGMILSRADVLLMTAHSELYSHANVDHIVLQALHRGKTVIAGGESALNSGALLTVMPEPSARTAQAVVLTMRALRSENPAFQDAQQQILLINQQVLRTLNQTIDTNAIQQRVDFPLTLQQDESE